MTYQHFEFNSTANKHFKSVGKYSLITAASLLVFAIANIFFFVIAAKSGKAGNILNSVDDFGVWIAALYAALRLKLVSQTSFKIVKTEGNDINLLNLSNKTLRGAFASLAVLMVLLTIRFLLFYNGFINAINC